MTKQIHLEYFALLREQAGVKTESIMTDAADAQGLYQELQKRYQWMLAHTQIAVAVNGDFAPLTTLLQSGDHVVFIPPVAGG